uniref:Sex-determining region Y protein n=1 Tax=Clastoptera arizonana TaxID=38151 RepID=A0A1B6C634_9HEMI
MAIFFKDPRHKKIGIPQTAAIISVNGSHNGTVPDVTLYNPQKANLKSSSFAGTTSKPTILLTPYQKQSFTYPIKVEPGTTKVNIEQQLLLVKPRSGPSLKQRIPRPPNAFMLFAHDFRRQVAYEYPKESNKDISIRLGIMWKNLPKPERERYFRSAKEVDAAHKQKYPDYVYNPKEARMRKALREQIRGERYQAGLPQVKWVKQSCVMNQQQSPIMLARQPYRSDNNKSVHLREQVERDARMLQNLPDYLDLSYPGLNIPTNQNEYPSAEGQPWCQYMQNSMQPNAGYLRNNEVKMPTSWSLSSDYNSDQNNYIQTSPRGSPYSHTNQQTANSLLINGNHQPTEEEAAVASICLPIETKVENNLSLSNENQPQVHLTDNHNLHVNTEIICTEKNCLSVKHNSELLNQRSEGKDILRLPGFHQAFGSTEIGRFSQPDGFFEAVVLQENEAKMNLTPPPPPPVKRTRAPRGSRKSKARAEMDKWQDANPMMGGLVPKKEMWSDWNPNLHQPCENIMNNQQRMMNYYSYHEENRPQSGYPEMPYQSQWQSDSGYYERQNYNQYYQPYYNSPQESIRNYHDCYPDYYYNHNHNWRSHPYYHPTQQHHPPNLNYYQQYSDYRHYSYQNSRWAMNRDMKYSSGMV